MITKEQLQTMSDFEVNKALTELIGHSYVRTFNSLAPSLILVSGINQADGSRHKFCVDYCKEPNDIMPLAFEYGVYYYNGTACTAISDFIDGHVVFDEPYYFDAGRNLRAIACCLILVLQEQ